MVPLRLSAAARAGQRRALVVAGALILLPGCSRKAAQQQAQAAADGGSIESRIAERVREQYRAHDIEAAGAWVWTGVDGVSYVLVDAQSAVQGIVQGRAELWIANEQQAALFGQSETMPSVAEFGAYAFQDMTGDTVPDFFGYVSDSSGVSYPVFIPGAHPGMNEEIAISAPGWHFSTDEDHMPTTFGPPGRPCALQMWAQDSLPDQGAEGWRWMSILRAGELGPPAKSPPNCATP